MTEAQRIDFIHEIAPLAKIGYKTLGKVWPSICIGMACIESGYGGSKLMYSHNAVLGQKVGSGRTATKYWSKKFFTAKTSEEYTVGTHTIIQAAFRAYDDLQQCILNYYELLNSSLYKGVKAGVHYSTQMQQIKACGYMTSSTEVNSVLKVIERYNLTQYDQEVCSSVDPAAPVFAPTLRRGDQNEYVKAWQTFLNLHGIPCQPDGIFGSKTEKAVKQWQTEHGLVADGIIGPKTWASIGL